METPIVNVIASDPSEKQRIYDIIIKKREEIEKSQGFPLDYYGTMLMVSIIPELKNCKNVSCDFFGNIFVIVD